jgi:hypothetical protein
MIKAEVYCHKLSVSLSMLAAYGIYTVNANLSGWLDL